MQKIQNFMEQVGFKEAKDNANTYTNESVYVSDLHDENVIKTPQGNLVVIDADVRLNTAELGQKGEYKIDDSLQEKKKEYITTDTSKWSYEDEEYKAFLKE